MVAAAVCDNDAPRSPHVQGRGRWGGTVVVHKAAVLVLFALAVSATPSLAAGSSVAQRTFGGANARVDTPAEVKAFVNAGTTADRFDANYAQLSAAEQDRVMRDGVEPAYSIASGDGRITEERPLTPDARAQAEKQAARIRAGADDDVQAVAAERRVQYATFKCFHYNAVGTKVFTYASDWHWTYGGKYVFDPTGHSEYASFTAPLYTYVGSQYLSPIGKIGTYYVGRETLGTFRATVGGSTKNEYEKMQVIVYGDGTSGHVCPNP
jgi:hypothetical protein